MLSTQCDELRERAKELRDLAPDPSVPYLVPSTKQTMALAMRSAASEMERAADTIWELRCKCADLMGEHLELGQVKAENAQLRQQLADVTESMGRVEGRCANLRELVREIWKSCPVSEDDCAKCPHRLVEDDEAWCDIPILMEQLGVLGVEVDR